MSQRELTDRQLAASGNMVEAQDWKKLAPRPCRECSEVSPCRTPHACSLIRADRRNDPNVFERGPSRAFWLSVFVILAGAFVAFVWATR